MKAVKLTDQEGYTRRGELNETLWRPCVPVKATGRPDQSLCTDGWIHFYEGRTYKEAQGLALLMNPHDANIDDPVAWEAMPGARILHEDLKSGARELHVVRRLPAIHVTPHALARTAVRVVLAIPERPKIATWDEWADGFLADAADAADAVAAATLATLAADAALAAAAAVDAADAKLSAASAASAADAALAAAAADAADAKLSAAASAAALAAATRGALRPWRSLIAEIALSEFTRSAGTT